MLQYFFLYVVLSITKSECIIFPCGFCAVMCDALHFTCTFFDKYYKKTRVRKKKTD